MYQPRLGRFLSRDPLETGGVVVQFSREYVASLLKRRGVRSLYHYVGNNPINALDPSGLQEFPNRSPGMDFNIPALEKFSIYLPLQIPLEVEARIDPNGVASLHAIGPAGVRRLPPTTEGRIDTIRVPIRSFEINLRELTSLPPLVQLGLQSGTGNGAASGQSANFQADLIAPWQSPVGGGSAEFQNYMKKQLQANAAKLGREKILPAVKEWAKGTGLGNFQDCPETRGRGNVFTPEGFKFDPALNRLLIDGYFELKVGVGVKY